MPRFGPVARRDLIAYLRALGFNGPFWGRKHQIMRKGDVTVRLPNPHQRATLGRELLLRILAEAGIDLETWEKL